MNIRILQSLIIATLLTGTFYYNPCITSLLMAYIDLYGLHIQLRHFNLSK